MLLLKRRCFEVAGLILFFRGVLITVALLSYQPSDWSWNTESDGSVYNLLGSFGAVLSDIILQAVGLASVLILAVLLAWGWRLVKKELVTHLWLRLLMAISGIIFTTIFIPLPTVGKLAAQRRVRRRHEDGFRGSFSWFIDRHYARL